MGRPVKLRGSIAAVAALMTALSTGHAVFRAGDQSPDFKTISPKGRYAFELSRPLTTSKPCDLWGEITVRDLTSGHARIAHKTAGRGKAGAIWQAFSSYTEGEAWSPDGLYVAYWDLSCAEELGIPGYDAVCHIHEIHFLSMRDPTHTERELVLSRYAFGGWRPHHPHTVIELNAASDGSKSYRDPTIRR